MITTSSFLESRDFARLHRSCPGCGGLTSLQSTMSFKSAYQYSDDGVERLVGFSKQSHKCHLCTTDFLTSSSQLTFQHSEFPKTPVQQLNHVILVYNEVLQDLPG